MDFDFTDEQDALRDAVRRWVDKGFGFERRHAIAKAGGKVDKQQFSQVGRALKQLGIEHIAAYSPEARGRSERAFQTHQGRLPQELARAGITTMAAANRFLERIYRQGHNREFAVASTLPGTAWVPFISGSLPDILCEHHERTVGNDNSVSFEGLSLQLPADE